MSAAGEVPADVVAEVQAAQSIVCATHNPMDGDGLGCSLALMRTLRAAGKACRFLTETHPPRAYAFLPGYDEIEVLDGAPPACDLLLGLDAGEPGRLRRMYADRAAGTRVVNIDHHISNTRYGDVNWVDAEAGATGEMIFALLQALELGIDPIAAQCLLVSLVTDTGRFCYSSTTARTLAIAADLVRLGASPDGLQRNLYAAVPMNVLRLRARAIEDIELSEGGKVGVLVVGHDYGAELGADAEDVKDLIDIVISIESVLVAALVRGLPEGGTKVSLRSKLDAANVAAFATSQGGGGHIRAAGFSSDADPEETRDAIIGGLESLAVAAAG